MNKTFLAATIAAAIVLPSLASAQTTVRVPIVRIPATVTGAWVLDPGACPDIREDFRDARVTTSRNDIREDFRDQRIVDCPASAYRFVPDAAQAPNRAIKIRRDGTATFIDDNERDSRYGGYGGYGGYVKPAPVLIQPKPVYVTPTYNAPTYTTPTYNAPRYTPPTYNSGTTYVTPSTTYSGSATYSTPTYSGSATYGTTTYSQPSYQPAPTYTAPVNNTGRYEYRNGQWVWVN